MTTHHTPRTRRLAGLAAALVAVGSFAVSGVASAAADDSATEVPATADLPPRLVRACLRVPNLQIRTDRLIERINGDAETRGSLLWLEARIATAQEQGRDDLVTVLQNRLEVRRATVPVLEMRNDALDAISARCVELGVDL